MALIFGKSHMKTTKFLGQDCVYLENQAVSLLVTQSVGPRIINLCFNGGDNLFAELPDFVTARPDGKPFYFYGGHRLWHAPENMPRTYSPDDKPVDIVPTSNGLLVTQPVDVQTGIEKSIQISLVEDKPQIIARHTLTNRSLWPVECAPWAITQFKTGGVAILPQSLEQTEFLPNRTLVLWPYSDLTTPQVCWGNRYILVRAQMQKPFKLGFPNPRGWLAYWLNGTLFVKRVAFDPQASYYDFGSSSECYCNDSFIELETLAPAVTIPPDASAFHTETWELFTGIAYPETEGAVEAIIEELRLE
jgi:hypothetical protein